MGRKATNKAQIKKQKKKEENAKVAEALAKVKSANSLEDPLSPFPIFKKYERNGLSVTFETKKVAKLDAHTVEWAFELTQTNMKDIYEKSDWGWKSREKKEEMTDAAAWYLVARDQDEKPVAFSHFRFDMEGEVEVLYCYEIQLTPEVRKKGLGKFMMQVLELMANKHEMKCVMLTVFKHNEAAETFFMKKLNYTVDEISPEQGVYNEEDFSYQILSKLTKHGQNAAKKEDMQTMAPVGSCSGSCCPAPTCK